MFIDEVQTLKTLGVHNYAIAIGAEANLTELMRLVDSPSHVIATNYYQLADQVDT
jgi:hypothetical protein